MNSLIKYVIKLGYFLNCLSVSSMMEGNLSLLNNILLPVMFSPRINKDIKCVKKDGNAPWRQLNLLTN